MPNIEERDHTLGPADAEVSLLEFGDFQCPHCAAAYATVKQLQQELGESMRFAFREFPLTNIHKYAEMAAESAEAAAAQGKFWEMHDYLFEHQEELSPEMLDAAADKLGLDGVRITQEVNERAHSWRVLEDMESGRKEGVHGTPTFFINGVQHKGAFDVESLMRAIDSHRDSAAA